MAAPPDVTPRDDPVVVELGGTITASSVSWGGTLIFYPPLTGTIFSKSFLQARWARTYLTGRITGQARLRLYTNRAWLGGNITAQAKPFSPPLIFGPPIYGRITAQARLRLASPQFRLDLAGRITGRSQAGLLPYTPQPPFAVSLGGRISGQAQLRVRVRVSPDYLFLSGRISGQAQAGLASVTGNYVANLAGRITAATLIQSRRVMPWYPVLEGRITAQLELLFGPLEIQQPLPPYPDPFPSFSTLDYLNRITSEHNQRPKYMATVAMSVDPMISDQQLAAGLPGLFDLDYSVGQQEDFTGQWIGKSRWIELPAVYFSWDTEGLGWNQANWKGPMDADNALQRLDDYHYRLLLYATVIANHWDGSIPSAYAAWDTLFQYTGLKVVIQDYGNMTMLYGLLSESTPDIVLLSLFTTGQMNLRPEGIELRAYALQPTPGEPFFSWDSASDSVHGWDAGYWGLMLTPGDSYIPAYGTIWDTQPGTPRGLGQRDDQIVSRTIWDDGNTRWDLKK